MACGRELSQGAPPLEVVLADGTRIALVEALTIGRAPRNAIQFTDPSVSRLHARILAPQPGLGPVLADAGSAHGTWLDGRRLKAPEPLYDGATIRVGDSRMTVERRRDDARAGRTIVVQAGMSMVVPLVGDAAMSGPAPEAGSKPRVRDGLALKRMDVAEGDQRWILRDPAGTAILRLGEPEKQLIALIDGRHSIEELVAEAESRGGPPGPAVLAHLLADLGEHGFLFGIDGASAPEGRLRRLVVPRAFCWAGAGRAFDRVYRAGGYAFFTRGGLAALVAVAVAGLAAFVVAIAGDYATPFVVAHHVGLGGLVFIAGRLLVVALHELAHGMTLIAFGRPVQRSGVKFILGFPYAFVDTTAALFEPTRRRLAVSGSGPLTDLAVGGAFALACIASPGATAREVSLQVALSAYTGALFNLNPLLDRDGYHMLVDRLGIPNLRHHAREWLAAGGRRGTGTQSVAVYALATIAWSVVTAGFVIFMSLRYQERLLAVAPDGLVWVLLGSVWALVLVPVAVGVIRPLRGRSASREAT
jgi:putative peptide zinc metalloprotease protein